MCTKELPILALMWGTENSQKNIIPRKSYWREYYLNVYLFQNCEL